MPRNEAYFLYAAVTRRGSNEGMQSHVALHDRKNDLTKAALIVIDEAAMVSAAISIESQVSTLTRDDRGFPPELLSIPDPPSVLYMRGRMPASPRVAVVGSRRADSYGLQIAAGLARGLTQAGVSVVSGGASGIDTTALQASLEVGGHPIAVLGTGLDMAYPVSNRELFEQVAGVGALVSEYPLGTPGRPGNFPRRNRLVSGLTLGVVVVRAAPKSGSLITAREAARQGRMVMAVPGAAGEELSQGAHYLIRHGAMLVESAEDVLAALGLRQPEQTALPLDGPELTLDADERLLYEALGVEGCSIDVLTERSGMQSGQVSAKLFEMELKGLVTQKPGLFYIQRARV
jgi:DNA processing protein